MESERPLDFFKVKNFGSRKERFLEASCKAGGIALRLCFYCADHPTGGVIHGAKGWKNVECFNRLRIKLKDVAKDCPGLWHWVGEDLHVDFYDKDSEQKCMEMRVKRSEAGSKGGKARAERAADAARAAGNAGMQGGYDLSTEEGRVRQADAEWQEKASARAESIDIAQITEKVRYTANGGPSLEEVQELMKTKSAAGFAGRGVAEECAAAFFEYNTKKGWKINGKPINDWKAAALAYAPIWMKSKGLK